MKHYEVEYMKERGGATFFRTYTDKADAIAAAKDPALYRATVWESDDTGRRFFIMRKIQGRL